MSRHLDLVEYYRQAAASFTALKELQEWLELWGHDAPSDLYGLERLLRHCGGDVEATREALMIDPRPQWVTDII